MRSHVALYGLVGGLLIAVLKFVEYRWLLIDHSLDIYGGLVAAIFAGVGLWLGLKLTSPRERVVVREIPVPVHVPVHVAVPVRVEVPVPVPTADPAGAGSFSRNAAKVAELAITPRELEILDAVAEGLSNREIAERLFVSENTVKTHASRLFDKLGARRRTQAVQLGKSFGLVP